MFDIRRLGTAAMFLILLAAGPARAAPEVGWWWNPNESGRGFFVESQNGIIYLAGYFYEPDGRATWLVAGGPNADPYNYQGRLLAYSNGQTLVGDYKPPSPPTDAGPVAISFSDDTHGTIVWPGGTIPIVRQIFGGGETSFQPSNGWWWNDGESGRGYSVELQGDKLFVVGFMYDDTGNPVWYYSAGSMASSTRYTGPWLQFSGGQTLTGPYRPPIAPAPVGQVSIDFTGISQGTIEIQDGAPATEEFHQKKSRKSPLKRQFKDKEVPRAGRLTGRFSTQTTVNLNPNESRTMWKWFSDDVDLILDYGELTPFPNPDRVDTYTLKGGMLTLEFEQSYKTATGRCESPRSQYTFALPKDAVRITANGYGQYSGTIEAKELTFIYPFTCTDTSNGRSVTVSVPGTADFKIDLGVLTLVRGLEGSSSLIGSKPEEVKPVGSGTVVTKAGWYFQASK